MKRLFTTICIAAQLLSCSNGQSNRSVHIFIPMNYTGWVNLVFNDNSRNAARPLNFANGFVYMITKDPQEFRLNGDKFPAGKYDMHYYYYNTDTTIELSWLGYPKKNIFFEGTIGGKSKNENRASMYAFSFYVSKEPLDQNGLSLEMLPKNKLLK